MKTRAFVDSVLVQVRSGRGGNGCASFRREKFVPRGGPDGGDGGRGGDVILIADPNENSLERLFYSPILKAQDAEPGRGRKQYGRNGRDLVVPVPCGTEVLDPETGERLADIVRPGQRHVLARGGRGGLGNSHFATSTHQAPREFTPGEPAQEFPLRLTLKIMADAGLVGLPNAGKSSLLRALTDAHPKVAAYPFTTLHPIVGTLIDENLERMTVADIPGLLPGAHRGVGLGHDFLRHIERAACVVYVIDMAGTDGRKPVDDYRSLRDELRRHNPELVRRPAVIVANKMDLPEAAERLSEFRRKTRTKPLAVSAQTGQGIEALKTALLAMWRDHRAAGEDAAADAPPPA